jgi:hypothetical protein
VSDGQQAMLLFGLSVFGLVIGVSGLLLVFWPWIKRAALWAAAIGYGLWAAAREKEPEE